MVKGMNEQKDSFNNGELTDIAYSEVINEVVNSGYSSADRTGTGTTGTCFVKSEYPLYGASVPLISAKSVNLKPLLVELEWYLKGTGDIQFLKDNGVKIWDAWADDSGDLGPVYGKQWRRWEDTRIVSQSEYYRKIDVFRERGYDVESCIGVSNDRVVLTREIDQMQRLVDTLRNNPTDRRMLLSAWNVGELEDMALHPCHFAFSLWSREIEFESRLSLAVEIGEVHTRHGHASKFSALLGKISEENEVSETMLDELEIPRRILCSSLMQRSVDVFVGMPFNIAGYGILTHFLAHITNHFPTVLTHYGCDVHIYDNHMDGIAELANRVIPENSNPVVILPNEWREIDDFRWSEVRIENYNPLPWIKVPVAV